MAVLDPKIDCGVLVYFLGRYEKRTYLPVLPLHKIQDKSHPNGIKGTLFELKTNYLVV